MKAKMMDWGSEGQRLRFYCEGCEQSHAIPVDGSRGWQFNGDFEKPTIMPSILTRSARWRAEEAQYQGDVCHMYVTDGNAVYLGDCTHKLAGQTVELPNLEEIGADW